METFNYDLLKKGHFLEDLVPIAIVGGGWGGGNGRKGTFIEGCAREVVQKQPYKEMMWRK